MMNIRESIVYTFNLPECECCGSKDDVETIAAMTAYPFDGERNSPEDPNRDMLLCKNCAEDYRAHWTEMWREYYNSVMP